MKKINSKGFGAVEVLLGLVIVGIIGGTGYYVYTANKNTNESSQGPGNVAVKNSEQKPQTASSKEYVSKEHGFKFSYPAEWGNNSDIEIKESLEKGKSGKAYEICIGFCDKLQVGFVTKDWVPNKPSYAVGFTHFSNCKERLGGVVKSLNIFSDATTCLVVIGTGKKGGEYYDAPSAYPLAQKKFSDGFKYAGVEVKHSPVAIEDFTDEALQNAYEQYYKNDVLLIFVKSFKEL